MDTDAQLAQYFAGMWPHLDEHARRLVAASQAVELGYGGISRVSRACGLSRVTLIKGVEELQSAPLAPGRVRREGGGRHALTSNDPRFAAAVGGMVGAPARGPPASAVGPGAGSSRGRRTTRVDIQRSRLGARVGRYGRAHSAWRPAVAAALDLQERPHACGGTDGPAPPGQPYQSHPTPAGGWLQPTGQPQDRGGGRSS